MRSTHPIASPLFRRHLPPFALLMCLPAVVMAAPVPGSVQIGCDVDRASFLRALRGGNAVVFRLWNQESGGSQCGPDYEVSVDRLVVLRSDLVTRRRVRRTTKITAVLGDDERPFAPCPGTETWLEAAVGPETLGCDYPRSGSPVARQRLLSSPFALKAGTSPGILPAAGELPGTFDVRAFGATGDGVTDDTAAIMAAKEAADPVCGQLYFPPGTYLTTGLVFSDSCVSLVGAGGTSDVLSRVPDIQKVATKIRSTTNAPVIKYTQRSRRAGADAGRWAMVRDLAIVGAPNAGPNQHCVQVDNRGITLANVYAVYCGGNGFYFTDSVASKGYNLHASRNTNDGFRFDDEQTAAESGSVNFNSFFGGASTSNGGNGVTVVHGSGEIFTGFDMESNVVWGIDLRGSGGERPALGCRFYATWDEGNLGGSVIFGAGSRHNVVDYIRYSSGAPNDSGAGNVVWGVDGQDATAPLLHQFAGFGLNRYVAQAGGSNATFDFSDGSLLEVTLVGDVVGDTSFANVRDGQFIVLSLIQDGTGGHILTWPSNVKCSDRCPALSPAPGSRDTVTFYFDGRFFWEVSRSMNVR